MKKVQIMDDILNTLDKELQEAGKHKECHVVYSSLQTDEQRVKFTMRLLQSHNKSPVAKASAKDAETSTRYREEGNRLFLSPSSATKPQLDESIEAYTKSIAYAPNNSKELALAFANRSAGLFQARLYSDCLQDIERALALPYPDKLRAKLYARKVRCLMSPGMTTQKAEIDRALENTREWLAHMDETAPGRDVVEKTLHDPRAMAPSEKPFVKWDHERYLPKTPTDNAEIPGASSALEMRYSEKFGKHVVATRDIAPYEVLAVMQPYEVVLVLENFYTHCAYCINQTWSSIPCANCVEVVYCSEECRQRAWSDHHDVECQVVGPLIALKMSPLGLMSLRLVVRAIREAGGLQRLKEKLAGIDAATDMRTNGFTDGVLNDRDYASVYTLVRNTEKRLVPDLFGRSLNATYIVFMLATRSELFGRRLVGDLEVLENDQWVTFVGGLIMRHQQIIPSNGHSLTGDGTSSDSIERAAALMPFYSLINHSCNPTVTRVSHGRQIVLYAISSIKRGEQIFDNYGKHYAVTPKNCRQANLMRQFRFTCECIACTENWPTYLELSSYTDPLRPLRTHERHKIMHAMRSFYQYYEMTKFGQIDNRVQMLADLKKMTKVLEETVAMPCKEFNDVSETAKKILALQGSRYQSLNDFCKFRK